MSRRALLSAAEVSSRIDALEGWVIREGALYRELKFPSFAEAFGFMAAVAAEAQAMDHHPDWTNVYNRVAIRLNTHDAGGVTALDFELAMKIDRLARRLS
jgi:4a-hydroxytetrahydrobiopterin dehydratase